MSATPSSAPAEATKTTTPPVETVFDDVKNNTQRELQKLKDKLEVKDTDSTHSKEWEKIKEKFIRFLKIRTNSQWWKKYIKQKVFSLTDGIGLTDFLVI